MDSKSRFVTGPQENRGRDPHGEVHSDFHYSHARRSSINRDQARSVIRSGECPKLLRLANTAYYQQGAVSLRRLISNVVSAHSTKRRLIIFSVQYVLLS